MSWSRKINVEIASRQYPFRVNNEDDEQRIRKAGKLINDKIVQLKQTYADKDVQDLLAFTSMLIAEKMIRLDSKAGSKEQFERLKKIDSQLDAFIEECTKS